MELLSMLQSTPLPTILVIGGLALLILSVVTSIGGKVLVTVERQKTATVIGGILLTIGIILYIPLPARSSAPVISGVTLRENYHESGDLIVHQDIHFRDSEGDTNSVEWEKVFVSTTEATIDITNGSVDAPPEQQKVSATAIGNWRCLNGEVYVVDLEVTLKDSAGNYSEPFLYTVICHE